ncbi:MAG: carboxypeptidase-like regulatory domain-containing protein [Bacteroidales bacterium]
MKQVLFYFFLFVNVAQCLQAKDRIINGVVKDIYGNPISYVNVGIIDKGVGTVSNEIGLFTISIPDRFYHNKLTVSHVSYKTFDTEISEIKKEYMDITLENKYISIPDIVVYPQKGRWVKNKGIRIPGGSAEIDSLGEEISIFVHVKSTATIEKTNLSILSCSYDSVKIRTNLYKLDNELKATQINASSVYQTLHKSDKKQHLTFLFDNIQTIEKGDYCIAFEVVEFYGCGELLFPLYSSKCLYRKVSLDRFEKFPFSFGAAAYIRYLYGK